MSAETAPETLADLAEIVRSMPRLIPVGNLTKPRLSTVTAPRVSLRKLSGMVQYDPGEFTFTALAGTLISELAETLGKRGQYLPFDALLVEAGSTLGGMVASGLSGPGRLRFGGVRDFILGVKFVNGSGELLTMGGKVVKNAAGFDLPKFFVGSLGRLGVLAEMTFKVFPAPASSMTLNLQMSDVAAAARIMVEAANSRWEPHAIDLLPNNREVLVRLGGPSEALEKISREILAKWPGKVLSAEDAAAAWSEVREFKWRAQDHALIKVPLTTAAMPQLANSVNKFEARWQVSAAGNVAFVSIASERVEKFSMTLTELGLSGLMLLGAGPLWVGKRVDQKIAVSMKNALDPQNRFPSLEE